MLGATAASADLLNLSIVGWTLSSVTVPAFASPQSADQFPLDATASVNGQVHRGAFNAASVTYGSYPYGHTGSLYDVSLGSNGSCGGGYLCTAKAGYDGPTGLGTPNGTGAF